MSRYKITFNKYSHFFSGTKWYCSIYDRKDENEYRGEGNTRREAKDDAWDSYWRSKRDTRESYSSSYSSSSDDSSASDTSKESSNTSVGFSTILYLALGIIVGIPLIIVISNIVNWASTITSYDMVGFLIFAGVVIGVIVLVRGK